MIDVRVSCWATGTTVAEVDPLNVEFPEYTAT